MLNVKLFPQLLWIHRGASWSWLPQTQRLWQLLTEATLYPCYQNLATQTQYNNVLQKETFPRFYKGNTCWC